MGMIEMQYISTRDASVKFTASQAITRGLAADGGLRTANAAFPILSEGDICGMFMLIKDEKARPGEPEENLRLARLAAAFLGREAVQ